MIRNLWQDFVSVARSLSRAGSVTVLVVLAMALGIGANSAIFSVFYGVLLKPIPYSHPEELAAVWEYRSQLKFRGTPSYPNLADWRLANHSFVGLYPYVPGNFNIVPDGQPERVRGSLVAPELFTMLGVPPEYGRLMRTGEDTEERSRVAVMSARLWKRLYHSDPKLVGRRIRIDSEDVEVIGIMPESFNFPASSQSGELWMPLVLPESARNARGNRALFVIGRLKPGVTPRQAQDDLDQIAAKLEKQYPDTNSGQRTLVVYLTDELTAFVRNPLRVLLGIVVAVLLIACCNVANLLLARAVGRSREVALRSALGATRQLLFRLFMLEGLTLTGVGGLLGILLGIGGVKLLLRLNPVALPRTHEIGWNGPVLAFTFAVIVVTSILVSLVPLVHASHVDLNELLTDGARGSLAPRSRRLWRALVVGQVSLSVMLLFSAAVAVRGLTSLLSVDPGVETHNVLTMSVTLPDSRYRERPRRVDFYDKLIAKLYQVPGVRDAGLISLLPILSYGNNAYLYINGVVTGREYNNPVEMRSVSAGYFKAAGIQVRQGRMVDGRDRADTPKVMMVNETAARIFWGDQNPVGSIGRWSSDPTSDAYRVVGVVADVRNAGLGSQPRPEAYFPYGQSARSEMHVVLRTSAAPQSLTSAVRSAVLSIDPELPVFAVHTMEELVDMSVSTERLQSSLIIIFALLALVLTSLGLYGVVSYSVSQRTSELGVRMALGATPLHVLRMVVGEGLYLAVFGIVCGGIAAFAISGLLQTWLSTPAAGPLQLPQVALLMGIVAVAASCGPALRAAAVDPLVAIRTESGLGRMNLKMLIDAAVEQWRGERLQQAAASELFFGIAERIRTAESVDALFSSVADRISEAVQANHAIILAREESHERFVPLNGKDRMASVSAQAFSLRRLRSFRGALPVEHYPPGFLDRALCDLSPDERVHRQQETQAWHCLGAELLVPIELQQQLVGVLAVGESSRGEFTARERALLMGAASELASLIENSRLVIRVAAQEQLQRELALASDVQRRLLPVDFPAIPGWEMTGFCLPARGVGGDYFDYLTLPGGTMGIALADVAGKGIGAALVMSIVQASLRSLADQYPDRLDVLAARLNSLLYQSTGPSAYATFFYGCLDPVTRRFHYVNAGHVAPFLARRVEGSVQLQRLEEGGTVIGLFPQASYSQGSTTFEVGDLLVICSDGVVEAWNIAEDEFGEDRLIELMREHHGCTAVEFREIVRTAVAAWENGAPQHDDTTISIVRASS